MIFFIFWNSQGLSLEQTMDLPLVLVKMVLQGLSLHSVFWLGQVIVHSFRSEMVFLFSLNIANEELLRMH